GRTPRHGGAHESVGRPRRRHAQRHRARSPAGLAGGSALRRPRPPRRGPTDPRSQGLFGQPCARPRRGRLMRWPKRQAPPPPRTTAQDSMSGGGSLGRVVRHGTPKRWPVAGALLGVLIALVAFAPASWLARALASATNDHLLIVDTRGSVWNGSGVLVLTGG